ncbi:exodeoxyribonuclease VII small subunit [Campylobacter corcagiensis]|uniref:Exodeoxyribonuclease VII small subunit n=1 Tax=Campylobacter corcagiensis TaxID=1448857 RepID=A0A7M1LIZ1_9BACT|nr:exodeoxyribonuclease VII small subunit [Campylobacter corcagiensis]QKF64335.1 exodeoxyribonuclease VII, small subunit [Campylobacter corcagiensis]QOQ87475.1 exodeoxyribonuclease VII small subunit [Campylobacter corcagiensis]
MEEKLEKSFEENVEILNSYLEKLKDENLNLNDSVEIYKQALKILVEAKNQLQDAKLEIIEIDKELGVE